MDEEAMPFTMQRLDIKSFYFGRKKMGRNKRKNVDKSVLEGCVRSPLFHSVKQILLSSDVSLSYYDQIKGPDGSNPDRDTSIKLGAGLLLSFQDINKLLDSLLWGSLRSGDEELLLSMKRKFIRTIPLYNNGLVIQLIFSSLENKPDTYYVYSHRPGPAFRSFDHNIYDDRISVGIPEDSDERSFHVRLRLAINIHRKKKLLKLLQQENKEVVHLICKRCLDSSLRAVDKNGHPNPLECRKHILDYVGATITTIRNYPNYRIKLTKDCSHFRFHLLSPQLYKQDTKECKNLIYLGVKPHKPEPEVIKNNIPRLMGFITDSFESYSLFLKEFNQLQETAYEEYCKDYPNSLVEYLTKKIKKEWNVKESELQDRTLEKFINEYESSFKELVDNKCHSLSLI